MEQKESYEWPAYYGNPEWLVHDRFGLFIHFGLFSVAGRHEWVMTLEQLSKEDYKKYFDHFNPDLFDAGEWARRAKKAGFKYAVLTAKHHEGFALWDTKLSDYKITNTAFRRDLVKEYLDAFRQEGLKVGLYFSLLDWYDPYFPVDGYHPQRNNQQYIETFGGDMERYNSLMHGQVKELLTCYGKIDYLWFDFSYPDRDWGNLVGKGKEDWKSEELEQMILSLQPEILINDRLGLNRGVKTPEQYQHSGRRQDGQKSLVWEACQTLNGSWGYDRDNQDWKAPEMVVKQLIDTVSKGGNLLLNVGPNGRGEWDETSAEIVGQVGEWMRLHNKAIIGCGTCMYKAPVDARFTQNGRHLYLHLFSWPYRTLEIENLGGKICFAQLLNDGSEIKYIQGEELSAKRKSYTDLNQEVAQPHIKDHFADQTLMLILPVKRPNVLVPVIELILE